ncbi:PaaI family thioesterase [Silvibacterium sp.]|uniref:PaaI family thioesterase n=1 Tax=Silvibacterium sp. TaxID=1964179 RepID=UPI0039E7294C
MQELLQRLRERNGAMMPLGATLGFTVESVVAGEVVVSMPCEPQVHNMFGYAHGGAIFAIADTAIGLAHLASVREDQTATTVESSIRYMRPALSGTLRATARAVKQGRTLSFYECDITDEEGRLMARISATMMTLDQDRSRGRSKLYGAEELLEAEAV